MLFTHIASCQAAAAVPRGTAAQAAIMLQIGGHRTRRAAAVASQADGMQSADCRGSDRIQVCIVCVWTSLLKPKAANACIIVQAAVDVPIRPLQPAEGPIGAPADQVREAHPSLLEATAQGHQRPAAIPAMFSCFASAMYRCSLSRALAPMMGTAPGNVPPLPLSARLPKLPR